MEPNNVNVPLVSIICPAYNHEKYIAQSLDGFIMQITNFSIEILVHDDASTDNTKAILLDYEKKHPGRFKNIYQTENQFSKEALSVTKILLKEAKGKYIAICEGDDYWTDPYKLQKQVDFLEANPDYVIHSGVAQILSDNLLKSEFVGLEDEPKTFVIEDFLKQNNLVTCTIMYRNVLKTFPNDFNNITFGDWYLTVLLLKVSKLKAYRSKDVFSVYRVHSSGVWSSLSLHKNYDLHIYHIVKIKKLIGYSTYPKVVCDTLNWYSFQKFKLELEQQNYISALETFLNIFYLIKFKTAFRSYTGAIKRNIKKK